MKDSKVITILEKDTEFGYTQEIHFIQENHAQGGKEFYLKGWERWNDGHYTEMPRLKYRPFDSSKEGNAVYKDFLHDGFTFKSREKIEPTQMDMR